VDAGVAGTDEEFREVLKGGRWAIGSEGFCNWVQDRYLALLHGRKSREDVAFRRVGRWLGAEEILEHVVNACGVDRAFIGRRNRKGDWIRPLAGRLLGKYGGKTQRQVAELLGLTTGAAVSVQQKRLEGMMKENAGLRCRIAQIESPLAAREQKSGSNAQHLSFKG